jgi:hypothetical protein
MTDDEALAHDLRELRRGRLPAIVLIAVRLGGKKTLVVTVAYDPVADAPQLVLRAVGWEPCDRLGGPFVVVDQTALALVLAMAAEALPGARAKRDQPAVLAQAGQYRAVLALADRQRWLILADIAGVERGAPLLAVPARAVSKVAEVLALAERRLATSGTVTGLPGEVAH